jgi:NAD(P)-dependent dehydrogenase (short-subunit alcohol dehydrogenase family)
MPLLSKGDSFRIVFLTSAAGWADTPGFGPYNISKSALNSFGMSLAAECSMKYSDKDIQINVLDPGEARTEMNQESTISPFSVVTMVLLLLSHPVGGPNGYFFHRDGRHLSFGDKKQFLTDLSTG